MLFSSLTFIFIFLPLVLGIYFISKDKYKNTILLVFSLFFYAWGEPKYIILMIFSIIFNYFFGLLIDKYRTNKKLSVALLIFDIAINLLMLVMFKYSNFLVNTINDIFNLNITSISIFNKNILKLTLPIGISFYTFQMLSYIIDLYKGEVKVQKNILSLGTYIAFFPQLIAGPIVRYETIENELKNRTHTFNKFVFGLKRFIIGLGKKVILANNLAFVADQIIDSGNISNYGTIIVWIAMFAYALQIYYDFSGYSDMAIGLGKMFGFTFLENFNYPYISKSITDFWRRWHISLSSWFRDYVYIPLGGNRVKKSRWVFNIMVVWMLTGLWHGASWNFVLWGLYFGIILLIEKLFLHKILDKLPNILRWLYSMILIIVGWTIFRNEDITLVLDLLKKMFIFEKTNWLDFIRMNYHLINYVLYFVLGIICMFPFFGKFIEKNQKKEGIMHFLSNAFILFIFVLCILFLIKSSYNPFIYFRF
jgi:alginate O-acetyltransferase complex protein AlgI